MADLKIRVDRLQLIEQIEDRVAREKTAYDADCEAHDTAMRSYQREVAAFLAQAAKEVRAGNWSPHRSSNSYGGYEGHWFAKWPGPAPKKPDKPQCFDSQLRQLRIGTDDTISLTLEQYESYVGAGCEV